MFHSIDHLNLTVSSLDASERFYEALFDFRPVESGTWKGRPWRILRSADSMLCLYEGEPGSGGPLGHVGFRLGDDGAGFPRRLAELGIPIKYGEAFRRPHSLSWYIDDPDDNEIEVTLWDDGQVSFDGLA